MMNDENMELRKSGNLWCAYCGKWTDHQSGYCLQLLRDRERILNSEVIKLTKLMRDYIDFMDDNLGTTADWPMEAVFDDEKVCQLHCDLLNAMKRLVKPEAITP